MRKREKATEAEAKALKQGNRTLWGDLWVVQLSWNKELWGAEGMHAYEIPRASRSAGAMTVRALDAGESVKDFKVQQEEQSVFHISPAEWTVTTRGSEAWTAVAAKLERRAKGL